VNILAFVGAILFGALVSGWIVWHFRTREVGLADRLRQYWRDEHSKESANSSKYLRQMTAAWEKLNLLRDDLFLSVAVDPVDWKQEDAEAFRKFLQSEPGAKFKQYLQRLEQGRNRYAVSHFPHEPSMTGTAKGFGQCLAHVISLSADVRPQQDKTENDAPLLRGEAELREMFTP
jgi:hypothetical protein